MRRRSNTNTELPEQMAIRDKCFYPTRTFIEFKKDEIEQPIPDGFDEQACLDPQRLAVKTKKEEALTVLAKTGEPAR